MLSFADHLTGIQQDIQRLGWCLLRIRRFKGCNDSLPGVLICNPCHRKTVFALKMGNGLKCIRTVDPVRDDGGIRAVVL